MDDIGSILMKYLEENNYIQTSFAKKMDISLSTMNKYILNKRQISVDNLIHFALELDFSLDHVFGIMKEDTADITKYEYDLIMKLRKVDPKKYEIAYKSISNILELLQRNEQNKY